MKARWMVLALCFAGTIINFIDRSNFAIAIPTIARELNLRPTSVGLLLSSFYGLYLIGVIPVGHLLDRFGIRKVYSAAMIIWSLASAMTFFGWSITSLLIPRLVMGGAEGASFPTNTKVVATWFPIKERGLATSVWCSAVPIGAAIAYPCVVFLMARFGWRLSFAITGAVGVVFGVFWYLVYRNPPLKVGYVDSNRPQGKAYARKDSDRKVHSIDWRLAQHRNVWGLAVGFFCANLVNYFFLFWFPSYLMSARHFSLNQLGTLGALPSVSAIAGGILGGITTDVLYRRGWSLTAARKVCLVGGLIGASLIIATIFIPATSLAIVVFCVAYAGITFTTTNILELPGDMAPSTDRVGFVAGVQLIGGTLAPLVAGPLIGLTVELTGGSYVAPVIIVGLFALLGAIVYLFLIGTVTPVISTNDTGRPYIDPTGVHIPTIGDR